MTPKRTGRTVRRVPPPLTRSPGHRTLPCAEVLAELPAEMALLLWQTCRSVHLWGQHGPKLRLFAPGAVELRRSRLESAGVDDELRGPLASLAALLENRRVVEVTRVVEACREVAGWAEGKGKLATALAFAQAAATASPEDASLAVMVGRFARMRAEYERAESWFDHALVLARLTRDRQAYAEAFAGLGNLYVQKGSFPKARDFHQRCLRAARRHALHEMEGAALHNLYVIAFESGQVAEAEVLAGKALSAYPAGNRGIARLAYDVAYRWMAMGYFRRALIVAREIVFCFDLPSDRMLALGLLARAAGGAGEGDDFEQAWSQGWLLHARESAAEGAARGLLGLGYGAASLSEWARAERAARKALEHAVERKEETVAIKAELLANAIRERTTCDVAGVTHEEAAEDLALRFAEALQSTRAAALST